MNAKISVFFSSVLKQLYICYYIVCMAVLLTINRTKQLKCTFDVGKGDHGFLVQLHI